MLVRARSIFNTLCMQTEQIRALPGVQAVLEGTVPGKDVVIIAGIHGNEPCGMRAFDEILPTLAIDAGRVTFMLGNPKAIERGVRFIDANLNRLFKPDELIPDTQKSSYEYARSRELMPLLAQADFVLDIHSSGTVGSTPFAICDRQRVSETRILPFPILSYGWDTLEPGGTDDFVTGRGGFGVCVECGYHEDAEAVVRAQASIFAFLAMSGALQLSSESDSGVAQQEIEVLRIHKTATNFTPSRFFSDFEKVSSGMLLGRDGEEEITAPFDGVVIFVRTRLAPGEEAFILGRIVSD